MNHWESLTNPRAVAPKKKKRNPWGVSDRQAEALAKLADIGCRKVVAYQMEITEQRLTQLVQAACDHMKVRTDMQAVVAWDRKTRDGAR